MFSPPVVQMLTGGRLHLTHGPIDVVLKAWGAGRHVKDAYAAAVLRFRDILPELCAELTELRRPIDAAPDITSRVGVRMAAACTPFAHVFVTPMAAVAGAVADELLASMTAAASLQRAFVNDGGDIAVFMDEGATLDIGVAGDFSCGSSPMNNGRMRLTAASGVGGIATSGARGRSFSLGIADAVTVLAATAATADVSATLIANAVDITSAAVQRRPARSLDPDSDLGDRLVTTAVGPLTRQQIEQAMACGLERARDFRARGLIIDAALMLAGVSRTLCDAEI